MRKLRILLIGVGRSSLPILGVMNASPNAAGWGPVSAKPGKKIVTKIVNNFSLPIPLPSVK